MLYSIKGKVADKDKKKIVVECYGIGYEIFVANLEDYPIGEDVQIFLDHVIKEDNEFLVGFKNKDERETYRLLLSVQGIGPKSALSILSNVSYDELLVAISNKDFDFIERIPGIGPKGASQIMLDLNNYILKINNENSEIYKKVKEALKNLKFKVKDINKVLPTIYVPNGTAEDILKEALRRLKANEQ